MGHTARLRIICDRFVAGHDRCALRRHLDSVPPETPIRDIVDCCRVWESHADTEARRFSKPRPERVLPIYTVEEPGCGLDDRMVAAVTVPPAIPEQMETLLKRLLPTSLPALPPKAIPVGKSVAVITGGSAGTEAHSATQEWDYRHGDFVAAVASGCTG